MNPSKVLLITLVGPYGEVDVAVRADLPAADLLPAFRELVGVRSDQAAPGAQEASASAKARAGVRQRSAPLPETRARGSGHPPSRGQQGAGYPASAAGQGGGYPGPHRAHSPQPAQHGSGAWFAGAREWSLPGTAQRHAPRAAATAEHGPRDIPLQGTLAEAGIVDGTVLYLYHAQGEEAR